MPLFNQDTRFLPIHLAVRAHAETRAYAAAAAAAASLNALQQAGDESYATHSATKLDFSTGAMLELVSLIRTYSWKHPYRRYRKPSTTDSQHCMILDGRSC